MESPASITPCPSGEKLVLPLCKKLPGVRKFRIVFKRRPRCHMMVRQWWDFSEDFRKTTRSLRRRFIVALRKPANRWEKFTRIGESLALVSPKGAGVNGLPLWNPFNSVREEGAKRFPWFWCLLFLLALQFFSFFSPSHSVCFETEVWCHFSSKRKPVINFNKSLKLNQKQSESWKKVLALQLYVCVTEKKNNPNKMATKRSREDLDWPLIPILFKRLFLNQRRARHRTTEAIRSSRPAFHIATRYQIDELFVNIVGC